MQNYIASLQGTIDALKQDRDNLLRTLEEAREDMSDFVDFLCEYADASQAVGYTGIGSMDIRDKYKEWLNND